MSMRSALILVILLIAAPVAARSARAQLERVLPSVPFSATAVQQVGAAQIRQKVHYDNGRLRIDGADGFATTILDMRTETKVLLMANHTYLVLPLDDELYRRFFPFRYARKMKQEQVQGVAATKYVFDQDGGLAAGGFFWLTADRIMVRSAYEDGVYGASVRHLDFLTDLKVGPVRDSLFVVPAGYRLAR
jgi:hypothetical protein